MMTSNQIQLNVSPKHVICFVAMPFSDSGIVRYETVLLPALREVLEQYPYYWQVGRADDKYFSQTIFDNIAHWMKRAHIYIADISELNPNVMMELGYMYWAKKPRQPLFVLESSNNIGQHLTDLAGVIRIRYTPSSGTHAVDDVAKELSDEFDKRRPIQIPNARNEHYFSDLFILNILGADAWFADVLSKKYVTMENFVNTSVNDIFFYLQNLGHSPHGIVNMISTLQNTTKSYLKKLALP